MKKNQTIDRLAKNIYVLKNELVEGGEFNTSKQAEDAARGANICTNKDILIIKYSLNDGRVGTIYQNVTNGATYQYIEWDGFLKYRKITWVHDHLGTISVTSDPNQPWIKLFNADNGNLFANGTLIELSKYVTTNSEQTITEKKTFTKDVTINNGTTIKSNINPGELKVFTYNNENKGFTIRTTGSTATNDLYPVQLLATNNTKSVQYQFPLTDNNNSNLPVNIPIKIITEKNIANVGSYGVTKLATVGVGDVVTGDIIKDLTTYKDHYTAASTYSLSFIYNHISYLTSKVEELQGQINELLNNNTTPDIGTTQAAESTQPIQLNTIVPTGTSTPESATPTPTSTVSFMSEDTTSELPEDGNTDVQ